MRCHSFELELVPKGTTYICLCQNRKSFTAHVRWHNRPAVLSPRLWHDRQNRHLLPGVDCVPFNGCNGSGLVGSRVSDELWQIHLRTASDSGTIGWIRNNLRCSFRGWHGPVL